MEQPGKERLASYAEQPFDAQHSRSANVTTEVVVRGFGNIGCGRRRQAVAGGKIVLAQTGTPILFITRRCTDGEPQSIDYRLNPIPRPASKTCSAWLHNG